MTHAFDAAVATRLGDAGSIAAVHPGWGNMVGPFGGITAATVAAEIERHPRAAGRLAALTVNFLAPLGDGEWELEARPVRTNRSNQHWIVTASQGGSAVLTATAVTAADREAWEATESERPGSADPESVPVARIPFPLPWLEQYEMRFVSGPVPLAPEQIGGSESVFWLRHADPRPWDAPGIVAASDAFFPRVFRRLGPQVPAGTVTLTTYLHATAEELRSEDAFVLLHATASRYSRGMFDQRGEIWGRGGALLATTHQLVYFKAPRA